MDAANHGSAFLYPSRYSSSETLSLTVRCVILSVMQDRYDFGTYIESLDNLLPPMTVASVSPSYIRPFIFPTALVFPATRKAIEGLKNIRKAATDCVTRRRQEMEIGKESRRDILDKLFAVKAEKGEKVDFGIDEIEQESYVAM